MKLMGRLGVAASLIIASASPAFAVDHQMRVNEVMLSKGGATTKQFIELEDLGGESFAPGGYTIQVFGADGTTQVGFQPLTIPPNTTRIILATDDMRTEQGVTTGNVGTVTITNLSFTLPNSGSACFKKSGAFLHCLTWGTVASVQSGLNGNAMGPTPSDGMSLQRITGCSAVAAPTFNAVNVATCPVNTDGPPLADAGVPEDGSGGGNPDGGGGGSNNGDDDDDGCSVGTGGGWLALVGFAGAAVLVRRRRATV